LATALFEIFGDQSLEVIHVEEVDTFDLANRILDIARHRDVHDEIWLVAPQLHRALHELLGENRLARARRRDDDVGLAELELEILPGPGETVDFSSQGLGLLERAIGHAYLGGAI